MKHLMHLTLILCCGLTSCHAQSFSNLGYFKVAKIETHEHLYLIYVTKDSTNYTILSKKSIIVKGTRIESGQSYYFELIPIKASLTDGTNLIPGNNQDINYLNGITGTIKGHLYHAKNLNGLIIPDTIRKVK